LVARVAIATSPFLAGHEAALNMVSARYNYAHLHGDRREHVKVAQVSLAVLVYPTHAI
jgi:hypothetical protein